MYNVFVGWGGNQPLALALEKEFENEDFNIIVGGGTPTNMHVGAQVIRQIDKCDSAILLIEDSDGRISYNLMFEWGYILAKMNIENIHIIMINKTTRELPSDLLGVWATELTADRSSPDSDKELACRIKKAFLENCKRDSSTEYFDIISNWPIVRQALSDRADHLTEKQLKEYAIIGCLAAYYHGDNSYLRERLGSITCPSNLSPIILFARTYINVFLKSNNMAKAISNSVFFESSEIFEMTLKRAYDPSDNFEKIINILCYDVYGLACQLFLKNEDLDADMVEACRDKALECFKKTLELTDKLDEDLTNNDCLLNLIRAYIWNDIAHLYNQYYNNREDYIRCLDRSVEERKNLFIRFKSEYPENAFLASKLEQEYMIALSEKCLYMEDGFLRKVSMKTVKDKYEVWKSDNDYMSSLIKRLEANCKKFENK